MTQEETAFAIAAILFTGLLIAQLIIIWKMFDTPKTKPFVITDKMRRNAKEMNDYCTKQIPKLKLELQILEDEANTNTKEDEIT